MEPKPQTFTGALEGNMGNIRIPLLTLGFGHATTWSSAEALGFRGFFKGSLYRAPKKQTSKNKDRDIPYKPPYNEAQ